MISLVCLVHWLWLVAEMSILPSVMGINIFKLVCLYQVASSSPRYGYWHWDDWWFYSVPPDQFHESFLFLTLRVSPLTLFPIQNSRTLLSFDALVCEPVRVLFITYHWTGVRTSFIVFSLFSNIYYNQNFVCCCRRRRRLWCCCCCCCWRRLENSVVYYRRRAGWPRNWGSIPVQWVQELKRPGREAHHTTFYSATLPKSRVRVAISLISHLLSWNSISVRTETLLPEFIIISQVPLFIILCL
jgi:hypothetical protein